MTLAVNRKPRDDGRLVIEGRRNDPNEPNKLLRDAREVAAPWTETPRFGQALLEFWDLSRQVVETDAERAKLAAAARDLGEALANLLSPEEKRLLIDAASWDPPPPLLVIESADELILTLPWELLRLGDDFTVESGRLDIARTIGVPKAPVLGPPSEHFSLLVTIAAPRAPGLPELNYEEEAFLITKALHEQVSVVVNEMGEMEDLLRGLRSDPAPLGVHFSGHGGPGVLVFESATGAADEVAVGKLIERIRKEAPGRLPRLFWLACCHGGDPPSLDGKGGLGATASLLHRDGIAQVVGYFGPVYDQLSTEAEAAFYREIARGRRTRDAIRAARQAMTRPLDSLVEALARNSGTGRGWARQAPFAWAQLVLYQRGPDYPIGLPIQTGAPLPEVRTTVRETRWAYENSRTEVLQHGFIGRRSELHRLRRRIREGRSIHVVQGLGGLGKSAFCAEALDLYQREGRAPLPLWCFDVEGTPEPVAALYSQLQRIMGSVLKQDAEQALQEANSIVRNARVNESPAACFVILIQVVHQLLKRPLAIYLDNLESLQVGPTADDPDALGTWISAEAGALWQGLADLARRQPTSFALLASTRYRHDDFRNDIVELGALPPDAMWRLLGWLPALRRLSAPTRAALVGGNRGAETEAARDGSLDGHPRSAVMLDALVARVIARVEDDHGHLGALAEEGIRESENSGLSRSQALQRWAEREQDLLLRPVLGELHGKITADLLFERLWHHVLDQPARELLVRASVLRGPGEPALLRALVGDDIIAESVVGRLESSSLLTAFRESGSDRKRLEVHPSVARPELDQFTPDEQRRLLQEGHRRAGDWFEAKAKTSPSWNDNVEACFHLDRIGEADRAFDAVIPFLRWLAQRGRVSDAAAALAMLHNIERLETQHQALFQQLTGDFAIALGNLERAGGAHLSAHEIVRQRAKTHPDNLDFQRDLSVSWGRLGHLRRAKGDLGGAGQAYEQALRIAQALAQADPSNAEWRRELSLYWDKLGDLRLAKGDPDGAGQAYEQALRIDQALAQADPSNAEWQRDLSVALNRLGYLRRAKSDLDGAGQAYEQALRIRQTLAQADPSNAERQRDLMVSWGNVGDLRSSKGDLDGAGQVYEQALRIAQTLAQADPSNAEWQRDLSVSSERLGDLRLTKGDLDGAGQACEQALRIRQTLEQADPSNAEWQRDLSVSWEKLGDLRSSKGDLDGAGQAYEQALRIRQTLAQADPSNAEWQRDLSVSWEKLGDLRSSKGDLDGAGQAYEQALRIRQTLAQADPSNAERQRHLMVSWGNVGDLRRAKGDLDGAGQTYEQVLRIAQTLAQADPSNTEWQRDLLVSWHRVGDLRSSKGDLDGAGQAYEQALRIAQTLAQADPSNAERQRDLMVSWGNVGDLRRAKGDLDGAGQTYEQVLRIAQTLAQADPSNTEWQRDLLVSWHRVGDLRSSKGDPDGAGQAYEQALRIAQTLAQADPSNAEWQRDLSVSWEELGDLRSSKGDLDGAGQAYEQALRIRQTLAQADPSNAERQRDLSVSWEKLGDLRSSKGDLDGAGQAYEQDLRIAQTLAHADPSNAEWQRDLSVSWNRHGELRRAKGDLDGAGQAYEQALRIAQTLARADPSNAQWQRDLEFIRSRLQDLRA